MFFKCSESSQSQIPTSSTVDAPWLSARRDPELNVEAVEEGMHVNKFL